MTARVGTARQPRVADVALVALRAGEAQFAEALARPRGRSRWWLRGNDDHRVSVAPTARGDVGTCITTCRVPSEISGTSFAQWSVIAIAAGATAVWGRAHHRRGVQATTREHVEAVWVAQREAGVERCALIAQHRRGTELRFANTDASARGAKHVARSTPAAHRDARAVVDAARVAIESRGAGIATRSAEATRAVAAARADASEFDRHGVSMTRRGDACARLVAIRVSGVAVDALVASG